jgi:hypothetical protein
VAALILKQIERNTTTMAATDTITTVTLGTTLTDTTKAILLCSIKCNSNATINYQVLYHIISTTQIQFERQATPAVAVDIEWQVIEYTQGITVQHIYQTNPQSVQNITITAVDLAKTFPIVSHNITGSTFGADDLWNAEITTTTNLQLTSQAMTITDAIAIQVVQIDDASVQLIKPAAWTTGGTLDITVTTIDPAKTFWFFTLTDNTGVNCDQWPYLSYVNSTTLRLTKSWPGIWGSKVVMVYVVSLSSGVSVQNISTVIASGNASVSPSIPNAITVANTALLLNGIYQRFASTGEADDNAAGGALALSGLTTTGFTATRAGTPAYAATTDVQVLEFSPAATSEGLLVGDSVLVGDSSLIGITNLID